MMTSTSIASLVTKTHELLARDQSTPPEAGHKLFVGAIGDLLAAAEEEGHDWEEIAFKAIDGYYLLQLHEQSDDLDREVLVRLGRGDRSMAEFRADLETRSVGELVAALQNAHVTVEEMRPFVEKMFQPGQGDKSSNGSPLDRKEDLVNALVGF
jgi:hypothetical protein